MVVTGKAGGLCPSFPSDEDGCRDTPGRLEKGLEGILFSAFHLETIPPAIFADPDQPNRLFSFSTDAASFHKGKDFGGQAKVPKMKQCQMSKFKVQMKTKGPNCVPVKAQGSKEIKSSNRKANSEMLDSPVSSTGRLGQARNEN